MNQAEQDRFLELTNFVDAVAQMRQAQKAYFKDREKGNLVESKRLEAAVDLRLGELGIKGVSCG